jgi:hypothetical protein
VLVPLDDRTLETTLPNMAAAVLLMATPGGGHGWELQVAADALAVVGLEEMEVEGFTHQG